MILVLLFVVLRHFVQAILGTVFFAFPFISASLEPGAVSKSVPGVATSNVTRALGSVNDSPFGAASSESSSGVGKGGEDQPESGASGEFILPWSVWVQLVVVYCVMRCVVSASFTTISIASNNAISQHWRGRVGGLTMMLASAFKAAGPSVGANL